ncbi:ankyrin repeat domain-containing protein [Billgrantia sp. LNSP4103-1]|uniref:ankyrin repeat domain-containing protein n=1 Tax=Billgrantia sp. LNSP4103-1 TaxID=3410266 RepID=UPI00403F4F45
MVSRKHDDEGAPQEYSQEYLEYYCDLEYGDIRTKIKTVVHDKEGKHTLAYEMLGREFLQAVERGNPDTVEAYVEAGMPVNYQDVKTGQSALHIAAAARARQAVRVLARQPGCNFILRDRQGRLPSELAYAFGNDPALSRYLTIREFRQAKAENKILKYRKTLPANSGMTPT